MLHQLVTVIAVSVFMAHVPIVQAPSQAPTSFKLAKIDVVGAKRYTPAEVAMVSGLNLGQTVAVPDLDSAARRLASIGLFKSVKYQYVTAGTDMTLTFSMEEEALTTPVVFDNFVWFSDDELTTLLKQRIPQFNGLVPSNAGISAFLSRELEQILAARRIAGRVEFTLATDRTTNRFIFTVTGAGAGLRVCAVRFDGAQGVADAVLQQAAQELMGADYSRSFTIAFANGTLTQLYRRRGFWKASIAPPNTTPDAGGGCGGVTVTLPVSEGPAYTWDHAEWTGNAVLTAKDLDAAVAMKPGDVADAVKIDAGLRSVHGAYAKQGYMAPTVKLTSRLDDAARKAVFEMAVTEGPQFVMGSLEILGLSPSEEASYRKKWRLETGAVYDGTYLSRFMVENPGPPPPGGGRRPVVSAIALNMATHQVTVKIEFR